ncbi:MAG TPA: DUF6049 family protein [Actinomycetaceae bacterium]|nr:DUF6049 family protein [Actinomycetaceae bacterium]
MTRAHWKAGMRAFLAVLCALFAIVAVTAAGLPATVDHDDAAEGQVRVELTDLAPAVLAPNDDLVLTGVVHNDSANPIDRLQLQVRLQQHTPISRSAVERWLDEAWVAGRSLGLTDVEAEVPAGQSQRFRVTVPAEDVGLGRGAMSWGPRGIEVSAWDGPRRLPQQDAARNFLLWWPDIDVAPLPVAVLGSLVPNATERREATEREAPLAETAAPRLGPLLDVLDRPHVDIALDPALLAQPDAIALAAAEEEEDAPDDAASEAADTLVAGVTAFAERHDRYLHALPWADTDAAALAHTRHEEWWGDALEQGRLELSRHSLTAAPSAASAGDGRVSNRLAWPVGEDPDLETLGALHAAGTEAVVLPQSALPLRDMLTYTPAGREEVALEGGNLDVLLFDEQLSRLLEGTHRRFDPALPEVPLDDLTARQLLLAQTAVIVRERPAQPRAQLLALPRDFDGDPALLGAALDALDQAPWLERTSLAELLAAPPAQLARQPLPPRAVAPGEAQAGLLADADRALGRTHDFASMLPDPEELTAAVQRDVLALASHAWRADQGHRQRALAALAAEAQARHDLVAAQSGSTLNLINNEAHLPVSVTNGLRDAVTLTVELSPRDPRLLAQEAVEVTIGAQESAVVHVPVHAVGSGDVTVDVVLSSPTGAVVGTGGEMEVRVRADWETVGTAVVAAVLVLLLVIGLIRTARRGRRMPPERA